MPACGSEGACLKGLWSSKTGGASPQCLGAGFSVPAHRHRYPTGSRHNHHQHQQQQQQLQLQQQHVYQRNNESQLGRLIWSLVRLIQRIARYSLVAPAVWLTAAWLCLLWFLLRVPLSVLGFLLRLLLSGRWTKTTIGDDRSNRRQRRCVLISGGSTVQAVHLARNLSRAGARVLVCELEGLFGLARFSTACAGFYALPRPGAGRAAEYVCALKAIVLRERVDAYVPVGASGTAYYDGLAKPHLELLGCECWSPGAAEVALLDDPLELLRRTRRLGLPVGRHWLLQNGLTEASELYEQAGGTLVAPHYALPCGPAGMRARPQELRLAPSLAEFTRQVRQMQQQQQQQQQNASMGQEGREEEQAWLVLQDPGGSHFVTCTSVRNSRLLASVTCRVDEARARLVPERRPEVRRWLERFFARSFAGRKFSGHLSFRLVARKDKPDELEAIGCRVGIGLAYLAHSTLHAARLLSAGLPLPPPANCQDDEQVACTSFGKFLDKREALFLYWDPLPYCLYCYLQLPLRRVVELLGAQQGQHKPPLAVVH